MVRMRQYVSIGNRLLGLLYFCLCMPCAALFLWKAGTGLQGHGVQFTVAMYGLCFGAVGIWAALAALGHVRMFSSLGRIRGDKDQRDVRMARTQNTGSEDQGERHVGSYDETP